MTSKLIEIISKHDKLIDFMEKYNLTGLIFATEEQLQDYIIKEGWRCELVLLTQKS